MIILGYFLFICMLPILLIITIVNYNDNNNQYKIYSILLIVASIAMMIQHYFLLLIGGGGPDAGTEFGQLYLPWIFYGSFSLVGTIYFFMKKNKLINY